MKSIWFWVIFLPPQWVNGHSLKPLSPLKQLIPWHSIMSFLNAFKPFTWKSWNAFFGCHTFVNLQTIHNGNHQTIFNIKCLLEFASSPVVDPLKPRSRIGTLRPRFWQRPSSQPINWNRKNAELFYSLGNIWDFTWIYVFLFSKWLWRLVVRK